MGQTDRQTRRRSYCAYRCKNIGNLLPIFHSNAPFSILTHACNRHASLPWTIRLLRCCCWHSLHSQGAVDAPAAALPHTGCLLLLPLLLLLPPLCWQCSHSSPRCCWHCTKAAAPHCDPPAALLPLALLSAVASGAAPLAPPSALPAGRMLLCTASSSCPSPASTG